jgi:hypothetical protein
LAFYRIREHEICDHVGIVEILWERLGVKQSPDLSGVDKLIHNLLSDQSNHICRNVNPDPGILRSRNYDMLKSQLTKKQIHCKDFSPLQRRLLCRSWKGPFIGSDCRWVLFCQNEMFESIDRGVNIQTARWNSAIQDLRKSSSWKEDPNKDCPMDW